MRGSAKEVGIVMPKGVVSVTFAISKADMLPFPVSKSREGGSTASQWRGRVGPISLVSTVSS